MSKSFLFRNILIKLGVLGTVLSAPFATLLAQQDRISGRFDSGGLVALKQSVTRQAQPQFDRGVLEPTQTISRMRIMAKPSASQQADLRTLLADQQNPAGANYHKWLTPEQFGNRFGLSQNDVTRISSWLRSQGFTVEDVGHARTWVQFSGTARQVSSAFHTEIHNYVVNGEKHFANTSPPLVPAALSDIAGALRGLNDFYPKPMSRARLIGPATAVPSYNFGEEHDMGPDDWAKIYDVAPLYSNGWDGTGQTIAVIGDSKITESDALAFRAYFHLPAPQVLIISAGPDAHDPGGIYEADLDVQWAGGIARNASIDFVYAENIYDAIQKVIDENLAPVMSISFGGCEINDGTIFEFLAQQANAEGITMLAASGDAGSAGCDDANQFAPTIAQYGLATEIPASMPEVTAVGGTQFVDGGGGYWSTTATITGLSALGYIPETSWNETGGSPRLPHSGILAAGGGGVSMLFDQPGWQTGPGVPVGGGRDLPDVAFTSAGHDSYLAFSGGQLYEFEGTSCSVQAFAGVVAILNQYLIQQGDQTKAGLGNINPRLYRLAQTPGVFHDITTGSNKIPCAGGSPDCSTGFIGFNAGPGYDLATGLGSADSFNLVTKWNTPAAATVTALVATPGTVIWNGPVQLTATVTTPDGTPPTGTVVFASGGATLGTAPLTAGDGGAASGIAGIAFRRKYGDGSL